MSSFLAAVRRLFSRKDNEGNRDAKENHNHNKTTEVKEPNEVQKVERKQHPYDSVDMDEDGPTVEPEHTNNMQTAPKRAPRSYEEVDIPPPNSDGKVAIK